MKKKCLSYLGHTNLELTKILTYANLPESQMPTTHAGVNSVLKSAVCAAAPNHFS
jgi:hypothetical protein